VLSEGPRFWKTYREISGELPVRGNLVPDAHIAALLFEHGIREIGTNNADFRKFDFLRAVNPFAG
jgi:predicted nucleic acid-binding protein